MVTVKNQLGVGLQGDRPNDGTAIEKMDVDVFFGKGHLRRCCYAIRMQTAIELSMELRFGKLIGKSHPISFATEVRIHAGGVYFNLIVADIKISELLLD